MRRFALGVLLLITACSSASKGGSGASTFVAACTTVAGSPTAVVQVTNTTGTPRSFFVTVDFTSPEGASDYGTGTNAAGVLEPQQTGTVRVVAPGTVSGDVACKVKEVTDL